MISGCFSITLYLCVLCLLSLSLLFYLMIYGLVPEINYLMNSQQSFAGPRRCHGNQVISYIVDGKRCLTGLR